MEHLHFEFESKGLAKTCPSEVLAGVVSSGNLEVMVEHADFDGLCLINVATSAKGFKDIWHAVLSDFVNRYNLGNLRVSINDGGSTPAVVCLRLEQVMEEYLERVS